METENDDNVLDYWKLPNGKIIVKLKEDDGLHYDKDVKYTIPSQLGDFILSNSKRKMNKMIREINGFYKKKTYFMEIPIVCI